MSDIAELRAGLEAVGKTLEIQGYAGCGHAFEQAVRFFARHLHPRL